MEHATNAAPVLQDIAVGDLRDHPDNPRLQLRQDVVDRLIVQIQRDGFGPEHALLVRPVADGFEILSGHHRRAAAAAVGLSTVPCWVRDMDGAEAHMLLALSNTQGELSPLEIGVHALHAVPLAEGGRGRKGGLSAYAERMGLDQSYVSILRTAAQVTETYCASNTFALADKARHLYEVSKAPRDTWPAFVEGLLAHDWTAADVRHRVQEVARFTIPAAHADWLSLTDVTAAYLADGRPTPSALRRLVSTADAVLDLIDRDGTTEDEKRFRGWLRHSGLSWDHRAIADYHADLIRSIAERHDKIDDGRIVVVQSSAADLLRHVEPGSVELVFTDPPYGVEHVGCWDELGEFAAKALRPGGFVVAYTGQYTLPQALDRLRAAGLDWFWCYAVQHDGAFFRMNATRVQCGWKPLLVMRNGAGDPPNWHKDIVVDGSREKTETEFDAGSWQQSAAEAGYWIAELTQPDALVADPFVGSGTTALACRTLGRRFVGGDIDERAVEHTVRRLTS